MDITEYDTNTLLINNVSSIVCRVFEPPRSAPSLQTFSASEVENALRREGYMVYVDKARPVIWCFHIAKKDGSTTKPEAREVDGTLEVGGYMLRLAYEGAFDPSGLLKNRQQTSGSIHTPNSSSSSNSAVDASQRAPPSSSQPGPRSAVSATNEVDGNGNSQALVDSKGYASLPVKDLYEYFITALLSSLCTSLASESGAVPLNSRTLLFLKDRSPTFPSRDRPCATLAAFRVYLTTAGSIVISLCLTIVRGLVSASDTKQVRPLTSGTTVLAAPLGVFATVQGHTSLPDSSAVQSPDTQITRVRRERIDRQSGWKIQCLRMLENRGVLSSLIDASPWIAVQGFRRHPAEQQPVDGRRTALPIHQPIFLWPSILCFPRQTSNLQLDADADLQSRRDVEYDPLAGVRSWYVGNGQRQEMLARRKADRDAAAAREGGEQDGRQQNSNGYSPVALRRTSNPTVMPGVMYPTPPDGVPNAPGVTPSFDGNVSSPGQQAGTATTAVDVDTTMTVVGPGDEETFGDLWDANGQKREQPGAAFMAESQNMFGDLGEDMFADADITDADFNFFDEQPEAGSADLEMPVLADDIAPLGPDQSSDPAPERYDEIAPPNAEVVKDSDTPQSPKFAKPELRHARSILVEENRNRQMNTESFLANQSLAGIKRQPSPFNPDAIFKRIKASMGSPPSQPSDQPVIGPQRRLSIFDRVDFDPSLQLVNGKYLENGEYGCPGRPKENRQMDAERPTVASYGRKSNKSGRELKDLPSNISLLISNLENHSLQHPQQQGTPIKTEHLPSEDGDVLSSIYDQDDSSYDSDNDMSPTGSAVLRKRLEEDTASVVLSTKDTDVTGDSHTQNAVEVVSHLASPDTTDVSVVKYFSDPEPDSFQLAISDEDLVMVAQIITEQAVTGHIRLRKAGQAHDEDCQNRRDIATLARRSIQTLRDLLPRSLGSATDCRFRAFTEAQDLPLLGPPGRLQPRPPSDQPRAANFFQIPLPHLELRRSENRLSVLPSAVGFWESLGLGPAAGPKDVGACCVFPDWDGVSNGASALLDRLRSVYESLKLGTFEPLPDTAGITHGLVPIEVGNTAGSPDAVSRHFGSSLADSMTKLAQALSTLALCDKNLVVFFVYTPERPSSIVEACLAFQDLFEGYKRALSDKRKTVDNELVLQLIALDWVASSNSVVVHPPAACISLCIETYDRCTLFGGAMPAPAIVLEQPLPRTIDFKFAVNANNPLHENACMHIAYAQSVDERWVTAAWTDNKGSRQMTASYCLARRRRGGGGSGPSGRPSWSDFSDVAHEIWETTHDLISVWKVHWRVVIVKCGTIDPQEAQFWVDLAQTESKANIGLTILTVDTNPSLQLLPPVAKVPLSAPTIFYTTPVSTPQPSMMSPEQSGTPATPMAGAGGGGGATLTATPPSASAGGSTPAAPANAAGDTNPATDPEPDTVLLDVTDTTWGAITLHRLNNSPSLTELNPALASGYLVKRGGPRTEDPPVAMEVNVVHADNAPRAYVYEAVLREMLGYYRALGTLARARGMVAREGDVRPWHVAAAEKGVRALSQLL